MCKRSIRWAAAFRTPTGAVGGILLGLFVTLAVVAPPLWGAASVEMHLGAINAGPSADHPFGTDALGRDILARVLAATRVSMGLALLATGIGVGIGVLLGTAPSVLPRRLGRLVTSFVNVAVAFPALLLALFFAVIFGVGTTGAVLAIGLAMAPAFARLTQTMAASIAGREFVAAARVAGVGRWRILRRHILPNIAEPVIVNATIGAGASLLAFAGLSFLGIGVQPPTFDWGRLLGEGLGRIYTNPAAALGPGLAVVLAGLAFNLSGESLAAVVGLRSDRKIKAPDVPCDEPRAAMAPEPALSDDNVLVVRNLYVSLPTPHGLITPVRGISFQVRHGEGVGVVGESGSGKSLTALAVAQLIESPGRVDAEQLTFCGTSLIGASQPVLRRLLGSNLALVFQDPGTAFNPTRRIGRQLAEVAEQHQGLSRRDSLSRAVERLRSVRIPAPSVRAGQYPHQFSGGMLQRAMIAMGLMATPRLVIADEPTTALDVTVQQQVLALLAAIRASTGTAVLLISHDITMITQTCERVLVMYAGRIVEDLPTRALPGAARHPYTRALLSVVPTMQTPLDVPLTVIPGRPPDPLTLGGGCAFAPRCPRSTERCQREDPALEFVATDQRVACWHPVETPERRVSDLEKREPATTVRGHS